MTELLCADEILDRLQERHPRFHGKAFVFVLTALHSVTAALPERRHITGRELAEGVRELALEQFGPMAKTVLEHWGIHRTVDVGSIVFAMVECGLLVKQEQDSVEDFSNVFDFEEAFERDYPWEAKL